MSKAYLFNRNEYVRYDVAADKADPGYPKPIATGWPRLLAAGIETVGTAVNWGNGKAYFFYADRYVRYDIATDRVDAGYPKAIAGNWPGMAEAGFDGGLYGAVVWGNGKAYFFRSDRYVRYDVAADRVDPGYPKPIAANWPGLSFNAVGAVENWGNGKAYFFHGVEYVRYDVAADRQDPGYPKPIAGNWPGVPGPFVGSGDLSDNLGLDAVVRWR